MPGPVDRTESARHALNVYLSSTPHKVRLQALKVYVQSAHPDKALHWVWLIMDGKQDHWLLPFVPELRLPLLLGQRRDEFFKLLHPSGQLSDLGILLGTKFT